MTENPHEEKLDAAQQEMQRSADEMEHHAGQLGDDIQSTRKDWEAVKEGSTVATAAVDPDEDDGNGDSGGFDDPEADEEDEDEKEEKGDDE